MFSSADGPGLHCCSEAEKEKGLLEKRVQRLEEARAAESAQAGAQLQAQRDAVAAELSAKDNKVNDLVEELGATQALLTEKERALAEVTLRCHAACLWRSIVHSQPPALPSCSLNWAPHGVLAIAVCASGRALPAAALLSGAFIARRTQSGSSKIEQAPAGYEANSQARLK